MRTILKLQAPPEWIISYSQLHSFMAPSALDGRNTSAATKVPFQSHCQSSKLSSKRTSGSLRPWSTTSGVSLEGTPYTSWKRPKTGHHTSSTSNLSWQNLTLFGLSISQLWFATFEKASNLLSRSKWSNKTRHQLALRR